MPLEIWAYPFLFFAAFAAGWVDSIAGGGGIISLPALMIAGVPSTTALGTNKCQSAFGSFTSSFNYIRKGVANLKKAIPGIIFTIIGASIGTFLVQKISIGVLDVIIPVLLIFVAIYMLVSPNVGKTVKNPLLPLFYVFLSCGLLIGFYDGFFGPGTGNFWVLSLVIFAGLDLTKATGYTKIMNFTSNITALMLFIEGGFVLIGVGLLMGVGQVFGAYIGSNMVIKNGSKIIRPIFILIAILLSVYVVMQKFL